MFLLENAAFAFVVLLLGLACWGTWAFVLKRADLAYEASTTYFVCAQVTLSCIACLTLGMVSSEKSRVTFIDELQAVDMLGAVATVFGGTFVAIANALITKAVAIAGVAVVFPAILGTGLVGGTVLNYVIDPQGQAGLLFGGLACCVVALLLGALSHAMKTRRTQSAEPPHESLDVHMGTSPPVSPPEAAVNAIDIEVQQETSKQNVETSKATTQVRTSLTQLVVMCLCGGVLSSLWSPLSAWASNHRGVGPYAGMFFFMLGQLFVIPMLLLPSMIRRDKIEWGSCRQLMLCVFAGFLNCGGLIAMFISGDVVSFAVAFGILQCSPVVGTLWGIYDGEMRGATRREIVCVALMMILYGLAVFGLAMSSTES